MDISSVYMGLELKNPLIASASPLSETFDGMRKLEDAGVAAIVMSSLFEEQIRRDDAMINRLLMQGAESQAESPGYFPSGDDFYAGPEDYLNLVAKASHALEVPVIVSLNCVSGEGWIDYAKALAQAGAAGLELNIYSVEARLDISGSAIEQRYLDIVNWVKNAVDIPVALKMSPFFSSIGHMAVQLDACGVDGLVMFNRFYQPDIDVEKLEVSPTLRLSQAGEIRLPLLWIALLHGKLRASLAATRGVESSVEVVKYLLAGADVVMTASALLRHGPEYAAELLQGLKVWMDTHGFERVGDMRGVMSHDRVADPTALERANYIKLLENFGR